MKRGGVILTGMEQPALDVATTSRASVHALKKLRMQFQPTLMCLQMIQ